MEEDLTMEEAQELQEMLNYPKQEDKQNIYTYFKKVLSQEDNSKTAFLNNDELGIVKIPVRTNQEIALYCDAMGMGSASKKTGFAGYFMKEGQVALTTSLSREGFLNKLAVTQKKESEIKTRRPTVNKGWFQKKNQPEQV